MWKSMQNYTSVIFYAQMLKVLYKFFNKSFLEQLTVL